MNRINFTRNFVTLRKSNNLTQEKMAEKLGVSRQTVTNWERGRNSPDVNMIDSICNEFNISIDELLYGENNSDSRDSEEKLDVILQELEVIKAKMNTQNLYDVYISYKRRNPYKDIEDIDFCEHGHMARNSGNYGQALKLYDTAAMYGDINGILSAIDLRTEILELCEDNNMSMYYSELSSLAKKLPEYGGILSDVLSSGDLL